MARAVLTHKLRAAGFQPVEASSAAEVRGVDAPGLACALLDLDLGDDDGAETADALQRASSGLPIAFFSAGASPEREARARTLGPVFRKPGEIDAAVAWITTNAR